MKFRPKIVIPVITGIITAAAIGFGFYKLARANSELSGAVNMLQGQIDMHRAAAEGRISKDPYLGFSEVIIDKDQKGYRPEFVPVVRYTGNIFPPATQDVILQTRSLTKNDHKIIGSAGIPLQIGDELELLGEQFYDLHAGATFVQITRRRDRVTGYLILQSFIAETIPVAVPDNPYPPLTASIDGRLIMVPYPTGSDSAPSVIRKIADGSLAKAFSTPLTNGQVHPVMAGNHLLLMLVALLTGEPDAALRETALTAARRVFDEYVFPAKIAVRPDAVAWPNTYDYPVAWGGLMKAPWFSGYSNGVFATASALMFLFTSEKKYSDLARQAIAWMKLPADQGGGLYHEGPFSFVAEYPSNVPAQPNIEIFDGEMIAAISVYNTAMLLGDPDMLRFAAQLAYSLVNKADLCTTADNRIQNSRYEGLINTESYTDPMKRWAIQLGIITKDKRFFDHAKNWRQSDTYWPANN